MVSPVTQNLFDSMVMDMWPRPAACVDFGIDTQNHYEALHAAIREGELTPEKLDEILGDGLAITEAVNKCKSNPHKGISFYTSYDIMKEYEE